MSEESDSEARLRKSAEHQMDAYKRYRAAAPGLFEDLASAGLPVDTIQDLRPMADRRALPILLKWLPLVDDRILLDDIIHTLTSKWARPEGPRAVLALLTGLNEANDPEGRGITVRDSIGSAMMQVTDQTLFDQIREFAADTTQGNARALFLAALRRYPKRHEESAPVLMQALTTETGGLEYIAAETLIKLGYGEDVLPEILRIERSGRYTRGDIQRLLRRIRTP